MSDEYTLDLIDDEPLVDENDEPERLEPGILTTEAQLREAAKPNGGLYVEYDVRGPRDVVLSGPVIGGWGPGRFHRNRRIAYFVLAEKYGEGRVRRLDGVTRGRWAYLIKNLREAETA